jgi:hypothetical protein
MDQRDVNHYQPLSLASALLGQLALADIASIAYFSL